MTFLTTRIKHSNQDTMMTKIFRVVIKKPISMTVKKICWLNTKALLPNNPKFTFQLAVTTVKLK